MKQKFLLLVALLFFGSTVLFGQSSMFKPQQIEISDIVLKDVIVKYQSNISDKDLMVVACESSLDSTKYYISAIRSSYKLYKNIPSIYTKINGRYVLIYSGVEHLFEMSDKNKREFLKNIGGILSNDILPDGKTRNPESFGTYDPMEILVIMKDGKKVYEDSKNGFGRIGGMPFLNRK